MALPLLPALEEIRNAVAIRIGMVNSGTLPARQQSAIDEEIRRAQRELFATCHWLRRNVSMQITLATNVSRYDLPNVLNLGGIQRVGLLETDGLKVQPLIYDDLQDISNEYTASGKPRYWKVIGDQIDPSPSSPPAVSAALVIIPAPVSDWTTLVVEGQMRDYPPTVDSDRIVVDGEAVIQLATIRMKEYLGIGGDQSRNRSDFKDYLVGLRNQEAPAQIYAIASRRVDGPAYFDRPSVSLGYTPYSTSWGPW